MTRFLFVLSGVLQNTEDEQTLSKVKELLSKLPADTKKLFTIYDQKKLGTNSSAEPALAASSGIVVSDSAQGQVISLTPEGEHLGYDPGFRLMTFSTSLMED